MSQRDIERLFERVRRIELVLVGLIAATAPGSISAVVRLFM